MSRSPNVKRVKEEAKEDKTLVAAANEAVEAGVPMQEVSEKQALLALYDTLKSLGIRSISDLENLIARA